MVGCKELDSQVHEICSCHVRRVWQLMQKGVHQGGLIPVPKAEHLAPRLCCKSDSHVNDVVRPGGLGSECTCRGRNTNHHLLQPR